MFKEIFSSGIFIDVIYIGVIDYLDLYKMYIEQGNMNI